MSYRDPNNIKPTLLELAEAKSLLALGLFAIVVVVWAIIAIIG